MDIKFHGAFVDLHAIDATLLDGVEGSTTLSDAVAAKTTWLTR